MSKKETLNTPRLDESVQQPGLKAEIDGKKLLQQIRARAAAPNYPTAECYLPNEVLDYQLTGLFPAGRARHMDECRSCRTMMTTLVPDPLRVQEFRQEVLARRREEERLARQDDDQHGTRRWLHFILPVAIGAQMVVLIVRKLHLIWGSTVAALFPPVAVVAQVTALIGRKLLLIYGATVAAFGILATFAAFIAPAERPYQVSTIPRPDKPVLSVNVMLNNRKVKRTDLRKVAALWTLEEYPLKFDQPSTPSGQEKQDDLEKQNDLNQKVIQALADVNQQTGSESQQQTEELKAKLRGYLQENNVQVGSNEESGDLRISFEGTTAEFKADVALQNSQRHVFDLDQRSGDLSVLPRNTFSTSGFSSFSPPK